MPRLRIPYASQNEADDLTVGINAERTIVELTVSAEAGETNEDEDLVRELQPSEARALAAALWHFAEEAERGR